MYNAYKEAGKPGLKMKGLPTFYSNTAAVGLVPFLARKRKYTQYLALHEIHLKTRMVFCQ